VVLKRTISHADVLGRIERTGVFRTQDATVGVFAHKGENYTVSMVIGSRGSPGLKTPRLPGYLFLLAGISGGQRR
jgi:hypothetical protein